MPTDDTLITPETLPQDSRPSGPGLPPGGSPAPPPTESPRPPEDATLTMAGPSPPISPLSPGPSYRFKSWDDAERSELEAKRRMHEATQEAATLRKQLADLELARDTRSMKEYLTSVTHEMHQALRAIPDGDPDMVQKELAVIAEHNGKIAQWIAEGVVAKQQAQAMKAVEDRVQEVRHTEAVEKLIADRLTREGLTQPTHRLLFDTVLAGVRATTPDFAALTTEEQFGLVLTPVREMLGLTQEHLTDVVKKTDEARRNATVLGRGGKKPETAGTLETRLTLTEQMQQMRQDKTKQYRGSPAG